MMRHAMRVLVVAGLVTVGWAVGHAQSPAPLSDFELVVTSPAGGGTEIKCVRGCTLTWAPVVLPATGPVEVHVPVAAVRGKVNADGCIGPEWQAKGCGIWGWAKR
jgi:hypothetical protein